MKDDFLHLRASVIPDESRACLQEREKRLIYECGGRILVADDALDIAKSLGLLFTKQTRGFIHDIFASYEKAEEDLGAALEKYLDAIEIEYAEAMDPETFEVSEDKILRRGWEEFSGYQMEEYYWILSAEYVQKRLLLAVLPLTKGKGEAARLARGAYADILNIMDADKPLDALDAALKAANDAARAYFIEHGECDGKLRKPKKPRLPSRFVEMGRQLLIEKKYPMKGGKFISLRAEATKARFERDFMGRYPELTERKDDLPSRILEAIARSQRARN